MEVDSTNLMLSVQKVLAHGCVFFVTASFDLIFPHFWMCRKFLTSLISRQLDRQEFRTSSQINPSNQADPSVLRTTADGSFERRVSMRCLTVEMLSSKWISSNCI